MIQSELFLRVIGVIYFIAFFSLWRELFALYGDKGIVPIKEAMERLKLAKYHFFKVPTLFWLGSSNRMIQGLVFAGMALSVFVVLDVLTPFSLFFLWLIYLSFTNVGSPFLNFQWDSLLTEVGFYTFLFSVSPALEEPMMWVFWLLLFRLMFSSAIVKYQAYTPHWRTLRAMDYHYESQPLPNALSFFMHGQSKRFSTFTTIFVFIVEGVVPFMIFMGDALRTAAFFILVFFQWLIILTGNFAFFNILTIALCFPLLFDKLPETTPWALGVGGIFAFVNVLSITRLFFPFSELTPLFYKLGQWGLLHNYGLFANMTKERYEIVIEGSDDAEKWKAYEFFTKPQSLNKPPSQIAPLQPRVEWQLWFIPMVPWNTAGWFSRFLERVLEGSPYVLSLFKVNPFPDSPPKYIRALIYNYRFNDIKTWRKTGHIWTRTYMGVYTPPIELSKK
ncbi:MAG: lipase maturation factor family protein [Chlamydiia bacterium]|nr:lipase maturation factor family protein [Chlamydiia bacterium]